MDTPAVLVARFLRTNDYTETLTAFLQEAGLPIDAGNTEPGSLTIERIVEEKQNYDLSLKFEKVGLEDKAKEWTNPAPSVPSIIKLPTSTNLLSISIGVLSIGTGAAPQPFILASTADRRLNVVRPDPRTFNVVHSFTELQDSPILSFTALAERFLVCTSMSGKVVVFDSKKQEVISQRKDHTKYVVQVASYEDEAGATWLATAGWDGKVLVYVADISDPETLQLGEPAGRIQLPSNPEALLFVRNPEDNALNLLVTRRDSSSLFYYKVNQDMFDSSHARPVAVPLSGEQNLAPYSNAWVAFTPAAIALSPTDSNWIAVATSSVPHMKLLVVRLLFPSSGRSTFGDVSEPSSTRVSPTSLSGGIDASTPAARQGRLALALQDREAAAIRLHCNTMAPQTQYSSPALAWRPDGTGVFVNSDDGVIRGIDIITGKVAVALVHHTTGSKIRCIWAGTLPVGGKTEECVLSGGFDQQLIVWRIKQ
ncbi:hypothetical protein EJ08DRAFT_340977 [Tothia fuscella]|uniref:LisH domain-containing protein n=1 Tax=Tothia fuscella TaxID=1048955 RepID=A0A9P4P2M7_9PEZI|nr:hypothetical protein EJ08DRAFT_340977 [Tothia fuscella]